MVRTDFVHSTCRALFAGGFAAPKCTGCMAEKPPQMWRADTNPLFMMPPKGQPLWNLDSIPEKGKAMDKQAAKRV